MGLTSPIGGDVLCAGPMVGVDNDSKTGSLMVKSKVFSSSSKQAMFIIIRVTRKGIKRKDSTINKSKS